MCTVRSLLSCYQQAIAEVTAPGQIYETKTVRVGTVDYIGFVDIPSSLREIYQSGLKHSDQDFYVFKDERYTYQRAWEISAKVGNRLLQEEVKSNAPVGIALRNYPEWIFAFMGITSIGRIAAGLNAWWSTDEMVYAIKDSGIQLLIVDSERYERIKNHIQVLGIKVVTVRMQKQTNSETWEQWIESASEEMPTVEVGPTTEATLLYTSGSTAKPKGVLSTHQALTHALVGWEAGAYINWKEMQIAKEHGHDVEVGPDPRHRFLASKDQPNATRPASILTVPLFHVTGLAVQMLTSFRGGRKLIGMYKWDVEEALRIIEKERITSFNGVPTMSWELTQAPNLEKYDLSSLQTAGGGGAPMAPEHSRQIDEKLARDGQATGWGMTETQGYATNINGHYLRNRPRSCGRAIPPICKVKAVDEQGNDLKPGESGELLIWGIMNFIGYWNDPNTTAKSLKDGWVSSGDIGYLDEEGYVFITDRKKEMVIRGGENVGCQEVETVLYEHPDIYECTVFGLPDERLGEVVAAVIGTRPGVDLSTDAVREFAKSRLAKFKVPDHIWIRFEQLPRTASEKIFKRKIREEILKDSA